MVRGPLSPQSDNMLLIAREGEREEARRTEKVSRTSHCRYAACRRRAAAAAVDLARPHARGLEIYEEEEEEEEDDEEGRSRSVRGN